MGNGNFLLDYQLLILIQSIKAVLLFFYILSFIVARILLIVMEMSLLTKIIIIIINNLLLCFVRVKDNVWRVQITYLIFRRKNIVENFIKINECHSL